jgi:hypothetical protein
LGQFVSSSGELIGANFPIAAGLTSPADPYIAHSSRDHVFFIVWGEESDVKGQLLSDDGSARGDTVVIAHGTVDFVQLPSLAFNAQTGEFLVVWADNRNISQGEQDIFAQLISIEPCKISVAIDIRPHNDTNKINATSHGVIPVAILTTDAFDATIADPLSVHFGPNGATEVHSKGHIRDVNHDGEPDLVLHFRTQETGIQCGDTSASLTGETFDGDLIQGSDAIKTVGCDK